MILIYAKSLNIKIIIVFCSRATNFYSNILISALPPLSVSLLISSFSLFYLFCLRLCLILTVVSLIFCLLIFTSPILRPAF